jgi:hypothetical protein
LGAVAGDPDEFVESGGGLGIPKYGSLPAVETVGGACEGKMRVGGASDADEGTGSNGGIPLLALVAIGVEPDVPSARAGKMLLV